jgi:hypothetical protein
MAMAETDLYLPVKKLLEAQGYRVKGEVKGCDVVAVRGGEAPVIVEMKTGFAIRLLLQGIDRQMLSDAVYLAIAAPKRQNLRDMLRLCRRLGLGLITVSRGLAVAHADPAPYRPRQNAKRKALLLAEFSRRIGDPNSGGGTRRPIVTAYRQDALRCAKYLDAAGVAKLTHIRSETKVERAATILQRDVYGWFFREQRGHYRLSAQGKTALQTFQHIVMELQ